MQGASSDASFAAATTPAQVLGYEDFLLAAMRNLRMDQRN